MRNSTKRGTSCRETTRQTAQDSRRGNALRSIVQTGLTNVSNVIICVITFYDGTNYGTNGKNTIIWKITTTIHETMELVLLFIFYICNTLLYMLSLNVYTYNLA